MHIGKQIKYSLVLISSWLTLSFFIIKNGLSYFESIVLFSIPFLILILKVRNKLISLKNIFLFSLIVGMPMSIVFDYIGTLSGAWKELPNLGIYLKVVPIEGIIWGTLYVFFSIFLFELFSNSEASQFNCSRVKLIIIVALLMIIMISLIKKSVLIIPYFYFKLNFFFTIPLLLIMAYFKSIKMNKVIIYLICFVILSFVYEYTAVKSNIWTFYSQNSISLINYFGFQVPIEEIIFIFFAPLFNVYLYKFFCNPMNNEKTL